MMLTPKVEGELSSARIFTTKSEVLAYLSNEFPENSQDITMLLFVNDGLELVGQIVLPNALHSEIKITSDLVGLLSESTGVLLVIRGSGWEVDLAVQRRWSQLKRLCRETNVSPLDALVVVQHDIHSVLLGNAERPAWISPSKL